MKDQPRVGKGSCDEPEAAGRDGIEYTGAGNEDELNNGWLGGMGRSKREKTALQLHPFWRNLKSSRYMNVLG